MDSFLKRCKDLEKLKIFFRAVLASFKLFSGLEFVCVCVWLFQYSSFLSEITKGIPRFVSFGVPVVAQWIVNSANIHEDVSLIPGLAE